MSRFLSSVEPLIPLFCLFSWHLCSLQTRGTFDELDELGDFLKDEPGDEVTAAAAPIGWRKNKGDNLFGHSSAGDLFGGTSGADDIELFAHAAEQDDLTEAMHLSDLQAENRRLRQQVSELVAHLRTRDEELAAAGEKIARLAAVMPSGARAAPVRLAGGLVAGPSSAGDAPRAKDLLQSKLGAYGFSAFNVEDVLGDIQESKPGLENDGLDRLLMSNGEGASGANTTLGLHGLAGSSFLGRQNSARRGLALPKSSQFGLFGDDDVDGAANDATPDSPGTMPVVVLGGGADLDRQDSALFKSIGAVKEEDVVRPAPKDGVRIGESAEQAGKAILYNDFIERLQRPENKDLVRHIKLFVASVLGPNGDASPPLKHHTHLEYQFYGTYMLQRRCMDFFDAMEKALSTHAAWKGVGDAGYASARNNLEKYVMTKLADLAIAGERDEAQDAALSKRMEILDFISPEALDVNPSLRNDVVLNIAQDELRKMATFKSPGDKIACVVKCAQVIFSVLNLKRGADDTSRPGADDFLPIFIYVVLKSKVPYLYTNCEYIQNYHNPASLMSKAGYCFVNLRSAVEFVLTLDASVLSMPESEFNAKFAEGEARWEAAHAEQKK